ncbi:MAG: SDR family NAD(P)-dependent oxidoreductase [Ruminococcaceae bacterium]|nr:SDR family NAD(P)-dependent oxidoreductase [Oscillospiraceae bacterium]
MKKVCVITGASNAFCAEFAREMSKNGYAVALLDTNESEAQAVADEICAYGGLAKAYQVDVLSRESIINVHKTVLAELGKCTVLINGVGGNSTYATTTNEHFEYGDDKRNDLLTFFNLNESGFDFVFDLNVKGVLIPTQIFALDMIGEKGCSIINISSVNAEVPNTKTPAYSSAKAAVSNFTQWLAVYFAKEDIRVNAIAPGFFSTEKNKDILWNQDGTPTERTEKILAATPMGRLGEPSELLGALKFLVDPIAASFVTGIVISVDGGFSAYSGV